MAFRNDTDGSIQWISTEKKRKQNRRQLDQLYASNAYLVTRYTETHTTLLTGRTAEAPSPFPPSIRNTLFHIFHHIYYVPQPFVLSTLPPHQRQRGTSTPSTYSLIFHRIFHLPITAPTSCTLSSTDFPPSTHRYFSL